VKVSPSSDGSLWEGLQPSSGLTGQREWKEATLDGAFSNTIKLESVADPRESSEVSVWVLIAKPMKLNILSDGVNQRRRDGPVISLNSGLSDTGPDVGRGDINLVSDSPTGCSHF